MIKISHIKHNRQQPVLYPYEFKTFYLLPIYSKLILDEQCTDEFNKKQILLVEGDGKYTQFVTYHD